MEARTDGLSACAKAQARLFVVSRVFPNLYDTSNVGLRFCFMGFRKEMQEQVSNLGK